VLAITGRGPTIAAARDRAYAGADAISWPGIQRRTDIAAAPTPAPKPDHSTAAASAAAD
jgi:phosphoribosylamine-glycine ligase